MSATLQADTIVIDDVSATAIAEHETDSRSLVISGRCYVTRERIEGHGVLRLQIEAEHLLFIESGPAPGEQRVIEDVR